MLNSQFHTFLQPRSSQQSAVSTPSGPSLPHTTTHSVTRLFHLHQLGGFIRWFAVRCFKANMVDPIDSKLFCTIVILRNTSNAYVRTMTITLLEQVRILQAVVSFVHNPSVHVAHRRYKTNYAFPFQ
ncbi:hypothetical protein E2C01_088502 [Portunus trituberculatus]|uniref:Uncharacterized protein n=1 Tax=Portunus trituberculatus TaxID=210409 RepID=A0A5B7JGS1_PORTR|nr:hypothetical protein [Portunus trituberculatus]